MFDVQISEQAEKDLRDIFEYIAFELLSPNNAIRLLNRLENAISDLDNMPEKYRRYKKEPWHSRGLRVFSVNNYLIFYIPEKETKTVKVVRVMYGGRDVDKELERHTTYN